MPVEIPRGLPTPAAIERDRQRRRLAPPRISPVPPAAQEEPAPRILSPGLALEVRRKAWVPYIVLMGGSLIGTLGYQIASWNFPGISCQPFQIVQLTTLIALPIGMLLVHLRIRHVARRCSLSDARETLEALRRDSDERVQGVARRVLRGLPTESNEAVPATPDAGTGSEISAAVVGPGLRRVKA